MAGLGQQPKGQLRALTAGGCRLFFWTRKWLAPTVTRFSHLQINPTMFDQTHAHTYPRPYLLNYVRVSVLFNKAVNVDVGPVKQH